MRSNIKVAGIALLIAGGMTSECFADDYAGCVAAYQRYNENIGEFNALHEGGRSEYCRAIEPEIGFAACEKFIKSGFGSPAQREWASQVSDNLAGVYSKCLVQ